jgi:hypothetical protein
MPDPKKVLSALVNAHEQVDGTIYADTLIGFVPLVKFLLDVHRSGGMWQSLGMARITSNNVSTIVIKLFVMIPDQTDAARYLQAAMELSGDHPES